MQEKLAGDKLYKHQKDFSLSLGGNLPGFELVYQTYGTLNHNKNNAILICHALTGNQHASGISEDNKPGWWNHYIGAAKPIDTNKFFVVCLNNLGGCDGSTGPNTINPKTNKIWGANFPLVQCIDWVESQKELMEHLSIPHWFAVAGGSLGGMQAIQWSLTYPDLVKNALVIASNVKLSAQNIAFNAVAREAIMKDDNFYQGEFLEQEAQPKNGLTLARMLGHITYLSDDLMRDKFGRARIENNQTVNNLNSHFQDSEHKDFQIENYLKHQGNKFTIDKNFDANTYILMTKALDYFDPALDFDNDIVATFAGVKANFLVISFSSDWRFPPKRSVEITNALVKNKKNVSYANIKSQGGHDSFLLPNKDYEEVLSNYLQTKFID